MDSKWKVRIDKIAENIKTTQKVRILLQYKTNYRSIFWFQVQNDGSFYFGPSHKPITSAFEGSQKVSGNKITIKYDDQTNRKILHPKKIKGGRISRHASGEIHSGSRRSFIKPAENIQEPQLEFVFLFEHPLKYPIIPKTKFRNGDILLNYPLDEARPLVGWIYASSKEHNKMIFFEDVKSQMNLRFTYSELEIQDMVWQIHLTQNSIGPWPSKSWVIWRSNE